jgi:putative ATP-grasp target RiPP
MEVRMGITGTTGANVNTAAAADPFAPVGSRFALAGSAFVPDGCDEPSAAGQRPWGLRRARAARRGRVLPHWIYDDERQLAVSVEDGRAVIDTVCGDPTADTTSATDGEDGPSSEDWDND